jgi:serralysin
MKYVALRVLLLAAAVCSLASCGGGGDSSETSKDADDCTGSTAHFSGDPSIDEIIAPKASPWLWNFLATSGGFLYTFDASVAKDRVPDAYPLTSEQRQVALELFEYIKSVTGITFQPASTPAESNLRIVNSRENNSSTTWNTSGASYIILDTDTEAFDFSNPKKGGLPYLVFLQQFGYVLGLVPPATPRDVTQTVMNNLFFFVCGEDVDCEKLQSTFGSKDLLALEWIYGKDGFGGERGYSSRCGSSLQ